MRQLQLKLHGDIRMQWSDGKPLPVTGKKNRAMIAMLAMSPDGSHSRKWLQDHLWSLVEEEAARASLRRCLADLRRALGADFDDVFQVSQTAVFLKDADTAICSTRADGAFLDGIDIPDPRFLQWRNKIDEDETASEFVALSSRRSRVETTIAILPMFSVTNTFEELHLADVLAQQIGRCMSRSQILRIISHLSTSQLIDKKSSFSKLSANLDADYLVHGSVQMDGKRFILSVDLINKLTGEILWSDQYQSNLRDFLTHQSDVPEAIARAVAKQVLRASTEVARSMPLADLPSHALFMSAIVDLHRLHFPEFLGAKEKLEELIVRHPMYSTLYAWLAKWHVIKSAQGWTDDPMTELAAAKAYADTALARDSQCAMSLTVDGMIQVAANDDLAQPLRQFDAAHDVDPNSSLTWLMRSRTLSFLSRGTEAVHDAERARQLSPFDPQKYLYDVLAALAHLVNGSFDRSIDLAEQSIAANPNHASSHRVLVQALQSKGDTGRVGAAVTRLLTVEPDLSISRFRSSHPAGHLPLGQHLAALLQDAGVPA